MDELDCVVRRKGKGLMQGIEITKPLAEVNKKTIEEGLLIIQAQGNVIRFVPPLIVEEKHIDEMIEKSETCTCIRNLIHKKCRHLLILFL